MKPITEAIELLALAPHRCRSLAGSRVADCLTFVPPPSALVLGMMLFGVLVRGRVLATESLMSASRTPVENLNGLTVILSTFFAATQVFNLVTPESGLPFLLFNVFFLVLLVNTLAGVYDRVSVLRSMAVIVVRRVHPEVHRARAISDPGDGMLKRLLFVLLEGVTLGTLTQPRSTRSPAILRLRRWYCFSSVSRCCPRGREAWRHKIGESDASWFLLRRRTAADVVLNRRRRRRRPSLWPRGFAAKACPSASSSRT